MTQHAKYSFCEHKDYIQENANGKGPPETFGRMMVMAVVMPGMRMLVIMPILSGFAAR
jgi:hypothetical protein